MNTERSLSEILKDIWGDLQRIIRAEILLAKTELREEGRAAVTAGKGIAAGAICLHFGILFLLVAVVAFTSLYVPVWAAALIVAVLLMLAGWILIQSGKKRLETVEFAPKRAIENIEENIRWVKQRTR
jgi:Flp pilus assembly protein TadB